MKNVLTRLLFLGLLFLFILFGKYIFSAKIAQYNSTFNSEEWKNWAESEKDYRLRWEMIGSLFWNYELIGKKKVEIIELLGEPENKSKTRFSYSLGLTGSGINAGVLHIKFDKNDICTHAKAVEH